MSAFPLPSRPSVAPTRLSAVELARGLAARTLSAVDVVEAHLAQIKALDPDLHAFITVADQGAQAAARRADDQLRRGAPVRALTGVPIAIKDLASTAGLRTTFGSPLFAENIPTEDDLAVARLRAAGAIILGKTNTPEFGFGARCENKLAGSTCNPHDCSRTSGGSSGGSAVAVATGMTALAHGTDFGGSVRTPAAFCGTVGLRPTPGRIPSASRALGNDMLATAGILARDVADAALMLGALAGPDARDPLSLNLPDFAVLDFDAPAKMPRLAATVDFGQALVDLEIADLFEAAIARIEDLHGKVVQAHPDCHGATETFETLRAAHIDAGYGPLLQQFGELLSPTVRWNIERGRGLSARAYLEAERQRTRIYRAFAEFFTKADILIAPTTSVLAFPDTQDNVTEINGVRLSNIIEYLTVTYIVSLVGYPVVSIPGGWSSSGLPMGLQLIARPGEEALLLRVAHVLERDCGFHHRWPGEAP